MHGWYSKYSGRLLLIYMLNREGIYCDTYSDYLKLLRERGAREKQEREARFKKIREDKAKEKDEEESGDSVEV